MNAKRLFHVSLPVLLLWLVSLPVHAAVEAGRILFARGTVSIVDASDAARGAGTGSVFHEGDRVVTGNNSIVQLRLSDGALTALRSNSDYQIQRQRFDEEADVYEQAGRLLSGWMRSVTGAIGARYPGNVSQGTSVATIGIRGTTYQIIHVPEEGLAEFPNLQPGTYVYLEEGQVEVSNEAGSRIVSPGQVVRIAGPTTLPELAPEMSGLFQTQLPENLGEADPEGFEIRDVSEVPQDEIANEIVEEIKEDPDPVDPDPVDPDPVDPDPVDPDPVDPDPVDPDPVDPDPVDPDPVDPDPVDPPPPVDPDPVDPDPVDPDPLPEFASEPFALSGGCSTCQTSVNPATGYAGEGNSKYLTAQFLGGGDIDLQAIEGELPVGTGSIGLYSAGQLVSQLHWGRWLEGDYTEYGSPSEFGDWHYIMADNVLDSPSMIFDTGLTGTLRYNYVGGSVFTGTDSDLLPVSPTTLSNQSFIEVDFSQFVVSADLAFASGEVLTGSTALESFYFGGISLTNVSETAGGNLSGAFVGDNAAGIMSMINYYAVDDSFNYWGSAVFQRDPPGLGAVGSFAGNNIGPAVPGTIEVAGSGSGSYITAAQLAISSDGIIFEDLTANAEASPTELDSYNVLASNGSVAARINWGTWLQDSFTVANPQQGDTGNWNYMLADVSLTSVGDVLATGLTGRYAFNYVGGTTLSGVDESGIAVADVMNVDAGQVVVDFGSFDMTAELELSDAANQYFVSGTGSVYEFYDYGVFLQEPQAEGTISGSMVGMFVGGQAEGIISALSMYNNINFNSYSGTAAFERDEDPLPPPAYGGVSAFSTFFSPIKGVLETDSLVVGGLGPDQFPSYAQLGQPGFQYELIGNSTQPSQVFSTGIQDDNDNIVTNVYWGIWDLYQVNEISEGSVEQTPTSDWHFMIADNPLTESMVASIGLTGVYTYFHVDGTPLVDVSGIDPSEGVIGSSSTVVVDFGNLMLSNAIDVSLDVTTGSYSGVIGGAGSLSDLYSAAGIGLGDVGDQLVAGSLSGTFAGAAAEALLGAVNVTYNGESYIGTALFQQDPAPVVGQ